MAYTQTDLDSIRHSIASGALSVRYADGRTVTYRSLADMERVERTIAAAIGETTAASRITTTYVSLTRD